MELNTHVPVGWRSPLVLGKEFGAKDTVDELVFCESSVKEIVVHEGNKFYFVDNKNLPYLDLTKDEEWMVLRWAMADNESLVIQDPQFIASRCVLHPESLKHVKLDLKC